MCDQCKQLDGRIAHYQEMALHVLDRHLLDGIDLLVAKLEAEKKALHPEITQVQK
jgi:hypothetical protein